MRIMTDTNIIISAFLFPNSIIRKLLERIVVQDQLVLCTNIIEELYAVFKRKFPEEIDSLDLFLSELTFDLVYTPGSQHFSGHFIKRHFLKPVHDSN